VLARDLLLVGMDERAAADDLLAADQQAVDPVRRREDEAGERVVGAAELEAVGAPDREVGALPRLERADVVPAQDGRAASRAESQRLRRGERLRTAAAPGDAERLLHVEEEAAALVRGRSVDAQADAHPRVEEVARPRLSRAEAQVR